MLRAFTQRRESGSYGNAPFSLDELWNELSGTQGRPEWIGWEPSQHHSSRNGSTVTAVIYHYTVTPSLEWTVRYFMNNDRKVSAHFVLGRDGRIVQMVPLERAAHHAGIAQLPGCTKGVNACSIGIEIVNWGELKKNADGTFATASGARYAGVPPIQAGGRFWEPFTDAQYDALTRLTRHLLTIVPTIRYITGHEDVALGRKSDPGPAFDWYRMETALRPMFPHHIGRIASPSLPASPTPRLSVAEDRRVIENRRFAESLGWRSSLDLIVKTLGFTDRTPDEQRFADAVAQWQRANGLHADGVLGPGTWRALQKTLPGKDSTQKQIATGFFKDSPRLVHAPLALSIRVAQEKQWPAHIKRISQTYNRLGGLMRALADETKIEVPAVLGVWQVESGGFPHAPGKAVIRFENHLLFRNWGKLNEDSYSNHFRHGGYKGIPGNTWENHQFRESVTDQFLPQHNRNLTFQQNQDREYAALRLAISKAGPEPALLSISIGGPQVLISNFRLLGYSSPMEMYEAFQEDERFHVLGFFDFCNRRKTDGGNLLTYLRDRDWRSFAHFYNGPGQVEKYAKWLQEAYDSAKIIAA